MSKYHTGLFKCKNPKKYTGNAKHIVYRSHWEFKYMMKLDHDPRVRTWASEEVSIRYHRPSTGKIARYYPDFLVEYTDGRIELIEIKPYRQTQPPTTSPNKKKKTLITEAITYETNQSKWKAAAAWCESRGIQFRIITERELSL